MTLDLWMATIVAAGLAASALLGVVAGWIVRARRAESEIANRAITNWQEGRAQGWTVGYSDGYRDGKNNRKRRDSARDSVDTKVTLK